MPFYYIAIHVPSLHVRYCKLPTLARKVGRTVAIGTVVPTINGLWGPNCQTVGTLCLRGDTHGTHNAQSLHLARNKCVCVGPEQTGPFCWSRVDPISRQSPGPCHTNGKHKNEEDPWRDDDAGVCRASRSFSIGMSVSTWRVEMETALWSKGTTHSRF